MRIFKIILFVFAYLLASCGNSHQRVDDSSADIEITDAAGREVKISKSSKFIILSSQTAEIFRVLDAESKVEGVNRWMAELNSEESPILSKLPSVGSFSPGSVNYEMIYEIANNTPEEVVVLTYNQPWADDVVNKLGESNKIKVIKLNLFGSTEPQKEIAILAKALDRETEYKHYINWFDSLMLVVHNRVKDIPDEKKVRVYWDASAKGHYDTSGGVGAAYRFISRAGGILISKDFPQQGMTVSSEWIMQENPDVILSHAAHVRHLTNIQFGYKSDDVDTSSIESAWDELISTPGINATNAVREKKVYFIFDDLMFGPSQPVGAVILAKLFYPELFDDINARELLKYYYEHFMRLDYKGLFIYPFVFEI